MFISEPKVVSHKNDVELSIRVYPERFPFLPQWVWWRFPTEYAEIIGRDGNPYVPAFLLPCMFRGERLVIESPVSKQLLHTVPEIQSLYQRKLKQAREIELTAPVLHDAKPSGSSVGCFFSCGVDSFYSLFKNQANHVKFDPDAISHLIFSAGFDIKLKRKALLGRMWAHLDQVALDVGLPLLFVSSNLKTFSDQYVEWLHYPFLPSLGLHLGSTFRRIIIASGYSWEQLPNSHFTGVHPELDFMWSTEQTEFIHDGCEANRFEKIVNRLAPSPLIPEHLHVCWRNKNVEYNCGVCEKCIRTMIPLYLGTGRTEFPCFSSPLIPENVRKIKPKAPVMTFIHENLRGLQDRDTEFDRQLKAALRFVAEQYENEQPASNSGNTKAH